MIYKLLCVARPWQAPASYGAAHNDEDHADDKEGNDQFPPAVLSTVIVTSPEVVEKKEMDVIAPDSSVSVWPQLDMEFFVS